MSRIDQIRRTVSARKALRAHADRAEEARASGAANVPVPIAPVEPARSFRDERPRGFSEFAAQVIGQHGERRGLRAGATLMDRARDAYNRTEWSGSYDRRARAGRTTREDI